VPSDDPETIGRYTVQRRLGVGGMSVVYEALDERIGRRVALKLMLVSDGGSDRERLRREAQALARVSHPNVVEVFEIGEHEGKAYVAMALVEGEPLDRWLRTQPRSPGEIVAAFVQAGEGLAAAHAHGLVHRDFKPGNVLMGHDGRVRVVDFGLVRESGIAEPSSSLPLPTPAEISGATLPANAWAESLTRTGAMLGTPAYMSPEQLGGLAAGPASDQFSFCVALYEALYGRHPFVFDGNWQQLPYNVLEGRVQRPPHDRRVSAALGKVVMRGLLLRPEARWPGMEALLQTLRRVLDHRGPRLPSVVIGLGLLVVGAGLLQRFEHLPAVAVCEHGAATMQRAWNTEVRSELRDTWLATALPGAADTWTRVDTRLQVRVDEWWDIHHAACGGSTRAANSAACLQRWADGLRTHLQVLGRPNESVLNNAVEMVSALPSLDDCSEALEASPNEPVLEVPPWQEELREVDALCASGQHDEAMPLVEDLLMRASMEGSALLAAEANLRLGWILMSRSQVDPAAAAYEEAYFGAKPLGNDRLAAESALAMLQLFGELRHRPPEAVRWGAHARAETERLGDPLFTSRYLNAWGRALRSEQRLDEALEQHQRALELQRELPTALSRDVALSHFQIGTVLGLLERGDEAREHLEQAHRIHEQDLGPYHPRMVATLTNIGIFLLLEGREAEGLAKLEQAYEVAQVAHPSNPWPGAFALRFIAGIHEREGRPLAAADALRGYLDGYQATREGDELNQATVELVSCEIEMYERRYESALAHCRKALASEDLGAEDIGEASVRQVMATIYAHQGKPEESLASQRLAYEHSLAKSEQKVDVKMLRWYDIAAEHSFGRALAVGGQHEAALVTFERASKGFADLGGSVSWRRQGVELDAASSLMALGRHEEARARLVAEIESMEARTGPGALELQQALVTLAKAEIEVGDVVHARKHVERALALLEARAEPVPNIEATARFVLARCLVASHGDRSRALALARHAEDALAAEGPTNQHELDQVRTWLAEHGGRGARHRAATASG